MKHKKALKGFILGCLVSTSIAWGLFKYFEKEPVEKIVEVDPRIHDSCVEIDGKIDCRRCVDHNCKPIENFYPNMEMAEEENSVPVGITDFELMVQYKYPGIVYTIYKIESNGGVNDSCKDVAQGMFNGLGYRYDMEDDRWSCYNKFEDVVELVNDWFDKKFQHGLNQKQAICLYGTGRITSSCDYWDKYVSMGGTVYGGNFYKRMTEDYEDYQHRISERQE